MTNVLNNKITKVKYPSLINTEKPTHRNAVSVVVGLAMQELFCTRKTLFVLYQSLDFPTPDILHSVLNCAESRILNLRLL